MLHTSRTLVTAIGMSHHLFISAVYDVSRADTFESLNMWLEEVEQFACSGGRGV